MANGYCLFTFIDQRKHAIIRGQEEVFSRIGQDRPPRRAYARINHYDMQGIRRIVAIGLRQGQSAIQQIVGVHRIADIHDLRRGVDIVDYALHGAYVVLGNAKIRG